MFTFTVGYTIDAESVYTMMRLIGWLIGALCALIAIAGHVAGGAR